MKMRTSRRNVTQSKESAAKEQRKIRREKTIEIAKEIFAYKQSKTNLTHKEFYGITHKIVSKYVLLYPWLCKKRVHYQLSVLEKNAASNTEEGVAVDGILALSVINDSNVSCVVSCCVVSCCVNCSIIHMSPDSQF